MDLLTQLCVNRLMFLGSVKEDRMHLYYGDVPGKVMVYNYVLRLPRILYKPIYVTMEGNKENVFEWVKIE
jgi:hypothetical protein